MTKHGASLATLHPWHLLDVRTYAQAFPRSSLAFALLGAIVVGSCFRIFVCFHFNPVDFIFSDPWRHWTNAARFPKGGYTGASDAIGYQGFLFVFRKMTFDNRYLLALLAALLSVLMPWTYYRAARAFGLRKLASLWVWAVIVWTPSLLAIFHYFMTETLLLLLDGFALWATARYLRKGGSRAFLVVVFLWTAAVLTKPTIGPFAAICGLWICWKQRPALKTIATAAVMVVVMLIPQSIRSKVALGFVAPFGNPWLTRIQHRCNVMAISGKFITHENQYVHFKADPVYPITFCSPSCFVEPFAPFSHWKIQRGREMRQSFIAINSAYGDRDWKNAYNFFDPDLDLWLQLWRENIVLFLFAPSWPESEIHIWVDDWEPVTRWMWAPIVLFVLIGNFRAFLKRRFELLPVAVTCLTLFLALQNVVIFEGRYRKPLEPLLILNVVWIIATWTIQSTSKPPDATALLTNAEN